MPVKALPSSRHFAVRLLSGPPITPISVPSAPSRDGFNLGESEATLDAFQAGRFRGRSRARSNFALGNTSARGSSSPRRARRARSPQEASLSIFVPFVSFVVIIPSVARKRPPPPWPVLSPCNPAADQLNFAIYTYAHYQPDRNETSPAELQPAIEVGCHVNDADVTVHGAAQAAFSAPCEGDSPIFALFRS